MLLIQTGRLQPECLEVREQARVVLAFSNRLTLLLLQLFKVLLLSAQLCAQRTATLYLGLETRKVPVIERTLIPDRLQLLF